MLWGVASLWALRQSSSANTPLLQGLTITQIKISGDEYTVLRNTSGADIQLSGFWLIYYNEASLSVVGLSNSAVQLPDATLQSNREIILANGVAPICGQVLSAKLPFALKDSAGILQIVAASQSGNIISYQTHDQVNWSNAKTNNTADLKLPSSQDAKQVWFRASGTALWQSGLVDYSTNCSAAASAATGGGTSAVSLESPTGQPPYVVLGTTTSAAPGIPAADAGLQIPQISEILPNPAPPQTDENDEFVELYNPNDKQFDLSGFILQSGTSTLHDYRFPDGSLIEPKQFKAYSAAETGLTLSNAQGQVRLLDPGGNPLAESQAYASAKDGQAWVYAGGKWQWTTKPTPGATNTVSTPVAKNSKKTKSSIVSTARGGSNPASAAGGQAAAESDRLIHPAILAGVGGLALLYAGYEYRHDLANTLHRLRRYREAGRAVGSAHARR